MNKYRAFYFIYTRYEISNELYPEKHIYSLLTLSIDEVDFEYICNIGWNLGR